MTFPIVDAHVHVLAPGPGDAEPARDPYDIWEYGDLESVDVLDTAGTIDQVAEAMSRARCDHFIAVNLFAADNELAKMAQAARTAHPSSPPPTLGSHRAELEERLRSFNAWSLRLAADRADMTTFVAVDPHVLGGAPGAEHLRWAHERGAAGIKIHPVVQRFLPDDPAMTGIFGVCEELGLGVVAHAGAAKGGTEWAEPRAFARVLERHPRLRLVLAHMGGARWGQARDLAAAFPQVGFDLCEIVAWTGAPGAPTQAELGRLIKDIGPERVLFGTDFPWYDVQRTIDQVMELPHLAAEEKQAMLGPNAVRFFQLPISF